MEPKCPYFGECGGCQLQHLNETTQQNYKLTAVTDALTRIGHLSYPPLSMISKGASWSYRRHITLHLRVTKNGYEAGYIGQDNHSLVIIRTCPIFNKEEELIISRLQDWIKKLPVPLQQEGRVTLLKKPTDITKGSISCEQYILSFQYKNGYPIRDKAFPLALKQIPGLVGIVVQTPKEEVILGNPICEETWEGLKIRFSPQTFIQNHPEQSAHIYLKIADLLSSLEKGSYVLDLYCGFGMTALLLSKLGVNVIGIECNKEAVRFAKENGAHNGLHQARFICADVGKELEAQLKKKPSCAVLNPPRVGVSPEVLEMLLQDPPSSIIYVSCMPSTLARDLKSLSPKYGIVEGSVYDMFPQTAHVETLVYLKRIS